MIATLTISAKLSDVDSQTWLADVFARIAEIPQNRSTTRTAPHDMLGEYLSYFKWLVYLRLNINGSAHAVL